MNDQQPSIVATVSTPRHASRKTVEKIRGALSEADVPIERELVQLRESAAPGPDVYWILVAIGAAGYAAKKIADPTLDVIGVYIRDRLVAATRAVREALAEIARTEFWFEFTDESSGEVLARYWLPQEI